MITFLLGTLTAGIICLFGAFLLYLIAIDQPQYSALCHFFYIVAIIAITIGLLGMIFAYVGMVFINWMYNFY